MLIFVNTLIDFPTSHVIISIDFPQGWYFFRKKVINLQPYLKVHQERVRKYYHAKEKAWQEYKDAMTRKATATKILDLANGIYGDAKAELIKNKAALDKASRLSKKIWKECNAECEDIDIQIQELEKLSTFEHNEMKTNYAISNRARKEKRGILADRYSAIGVIHRDKRDEINAKIKDLKGQKRETQKSAKERTKNRPVYDNYHDSLDLTKHWQRKYDKAQKSYLALQEECSSLREAAKAAQAEYEHVLSEFNLAKAREKERQERAALEKAEQSKIQAADRKIFEALDKCNDQELICKAESSSFRERIEQNWELDKAGVVWSERSQDKLAFEN